MSLIEVRHLGHRFASGVIGLHDIHFSLQEGEFAVLAGPNGSGKSTLLRHLNGLLRATQGDVYLDGRPVSRNPAFARRFVGMVFQDAEHQIVGETVSGDIAFGPENLGLNHVEIRQRVTEALAAVNLNELAQQRPHLLSGGEKRRLAIAGVLAMHPRVLVLDEPFANLDYPGLQQVLSQIRRLHQAGHTLIVSTHDLEKVISLAGRLIILSRGRVVRDGHPAQYIGELEDFGIRRPCPACLDRRRTD